MKPTGTFLLAMVATTFAMAVDFSTRSARQANAVYDREVAAAIDAHAKALASARLKYAKALEDAAKRAATDGNLDEVAKIGEERARLAEKPDTRSLWVHSTGYFQRLHDGAWMEFQPSGRRTFLQETARTAAYVQIELNGSRIQLGENGSVVAEAGSATFRNHYKGHWEPQ